MATIQTLGTEYGMEPHEVAAALDLGTDYRENAELDEATEVDYREVLEIMAEQAER